MTEFAFVLAMEDGEFHEVIVHAPNYSMALNAVSDRFPDATVIGHRARQVPPGDTEPEAA